MKVLNINVSIHSLTGGGTAERTYQLSRFLARNDIECSILTLKIDSLTPEILKEFDKINITFLSCLWKRYYIPVVSRKKLRTLIKKADIIHLIGHWTLLNALVYLTAKSLKKPYVFSPAGALPICGRSKFIKKIYNLLIGNSIIKNADGYIAITSDEILHFEEYGVNKNDITLIPNGVCNNDFERILTKKNPFIFPAKKYILFVGRLNFIKGPDLLLQAFANVAEEFKEYHLIFAGPDSGMLKTLKAKTINLALQNRIHFIGYVSGQIKTEIYQNASLLVIPSRQEAMSIVVLEGGILGKPVLITDQCGFPEVELINGGQVVSASIEGLEKGLRNLLTNYKNLSKLGSNLKNYIDGKYSWDSQVQKLKHLYQQILSVK